MGFKERTMHVGEDKAYHYGVQQTRSANETKSYCMMIICATFVHKAYLELYFDTSMIPQHIRDFVNKVKNCDDILLSVVVTKFLNDLGRPQSGVIDVKEKKPIKTLDADYSE